MSGRPPLYGEEDALRAWEKSLVEKVAGAKEKEAVSGRSETDAALMATRMAVEHTGLDIFCGVEDEERLWWTTSN